MSKTSPNRTGSDGDYELDSQNSTSDSPQYSKYRSPSSFSQESEAGPSGDNAFLYKERFPHFSGQYNEYAVNVVQLEQDKTMDCNTDSSSLDEELYGLNNTYLNNLNILREKLNMSKITDCSSTIQSMHELKTQDAFFPVCKQSKDSSCENSIWNVIKSNQNSDNYENIKQSEIGTSHTPVEILFQSNKSVISDTSTTSTTTEYCIPNKKICLRSNTPTIETNHICSELVHSSSGSTLLLSDPTSGSYGVPCKRICVRDGTSELDAVPLIAHSNCDDEEIDKSNINNNSREKQTFVINDIDLYINLPSSVPDSSDASYNQSPIEPNIVIIDNLKNKKSEGNVNQCFLSFNQNYLNNIKESEVHVDKSNNWRFKNTSNTSPFSGMGTNVSRGTSNNDLKDKYRASKSTSMTNIDKCKQYSTKQQETDLSTSTLPKYTDISSCKTELKYYNSLYCSSLELPKITTQYLIFPAISNITNVTGKFSNTFLQTEFQSPKSKCFMGDSEKFLEDALIYKKHINTDKEFPDFKKKATMLLNSKSPDTDTLQSSFSVIEKPPQKLPFNRKYQSTDISFYTISSFDDINNSRHYSVPHNINSSSDTEDSDSECCCINIFFSRKKLRNFFWK